MIMEVPEEMILFSRQLSEIFLELSSNFMNWKFLLIILNLLLSVPECLIIDINSY